MIEFLEEMGLDPDRVSGQRDFSAGIGNIYYAKAKVIEQPDQRELTFIVAATNLRRAAANSLLLGETESARQFFDAAASAYAAAGSAYGLLLSNLGYGETLDNRFEFNQFRNAQDVFIMFRPRRSIKSIINHQEEDVRLRHQLDEFRTQRMGMLGLSVGFYLELFDSLMLGQKGLEEVTVKRAVMPLLALYTSVIARSKNDGYHWKRLATPFHPAEPDVMAVLMSMGRSLDQKGVSLQRVVADLPISGDALRLIRGTLLQYHAWG